MSLKELEVITCVGGDTEVIYVTIMVSFSPLKLSLIHWIESKEQKLAE